MIRFRNLLGLVLAAIAVLIVGCGGAEVAQPDTYTPDRIAAIESYSPRVLALRDRFPELERHIQRQDWMDIRSFIRGPMGELRTSLDRVASRLLPQDQEQAQALAEDLARHLEQLDSAAQSFNQAELAKQYQLALEDFDAFISLIPSAEETADTAPPATGATGSA